MTKPIVSAAFMQLVEQGRLDLDADVGDIVADFKNSVVLDRFDENGVPVLHRAKSAVTLRQLLAQTSGISHEAWGPLRRQWHRKFGIGGFGKEARRVPLCFEPGMDWVYGLGLDWVMECIQEVTGLTLEQYLQENIFRPLGMSSTSFHLRPDTKDRLAALHVRECGAPVVANTVLQKSFAAYGFWHDYGEGEEHGGLYSTAGDYIQFLRTIIGEGVCDETKILKAATIRQMGENQIGSLLVHFPPMLSSGGFGRDLTYMLGAGQKAKWGLGWMVNEETTMTGRGPGGMSWFGGFDTHMWADRANGFCGVVMMQTKPAASDDAMQIVFDFEKMLHDISVRCGERHEARQ